MVNYSYTSGAKFRPFSYQEMLQPLAAYTQEYNTIEEALGELGSKADVFNRLANQQTDKKAYSMYKTYADDLTAQAESLAKNGLTPASRQNLIDMKRRYSSEITPIEQAYNNRMKQAEEQRKALLQDPTLMFNRLAATTSLDAYLDNPELGYEPYSGKLITSQVASMAQNLAKELRSYGKGKPIDEFTNTFLKRYGLSSAEVLQAINNPDDPRSSKALKAIMDSAIGSTPIASWKDTALLSRAYDYAKQGLWSAIGQDQVSPIENYGARLDEQYRRKAAEEKQQMLNGLAINPLNIYSSKEMTEASNVIKKYSKYFQTDADGNIKLTKEGWEEYNKKKDVWKSADGAGSYKMKNAPSEFKVFLDSIGGEAGWNKYINDHKTDTYDATKATEFDYTISGTQQGDMKNAIMTANRGLPLREVDYDSKSKTFKDTGEEITMEDLKNDKYKVTATRFSPYGTTVMVQDDEGNVRRFRMPAGINTVNEQNRDKMMKNALIWQQLVSTGEYKDANGSIHRATPDEITYAQGQYKKALQKAYMFHSQLGVSNKTKEQEYYHYSY